jgi:hypothetical protein
MYGGYSVALEGVQVKAVGNGQVGWHRVAGRRIRNITYIMCFGHFHRNYKIKNPLVFDFIKGPTNIAQFYQSPIYGT